MSRLPLLLFSLLTLLLSGFSPKPPAFHSPSPHRSSTTQAPAQFDQPGSYIDDNFPENRFFGPNRSREKSFKINKLLFEAGNDWRGILSVFTTEHVNFNHVNWATTLSKLGRLRERDVASMKLVGGFHDLIRDLSGEMTASPELKKFGGVREVANIVHALAKMRASGDDVDAILNATDNDAEWLVANGNSQEIANTAWAFATLNTPAPNLFKKIEERASFLVENGKPQEIANTAWAFATLGCDAPALFSAVDSCSEFLIEKGIPQEIANTATAFAEMGILPVSFFACLEKRAEDFLRRAIEQDICNVCWSLAVLDLAPGYERLLRSLWEHAMRTDATKFTVDELKQLVQAELHARSSGVELSPTVPPALRRRMAEAADIVDRSEGKFDKIFSSLLTEVGFEHERQVYPSKELGQMLSVDLACPIRKIAVELDGPTHFLSSGRENGRTIAKRRLLERLGWKVVNISYKHAKRMDSREFQEKHKAKGDKKELKKLYLKKLLREKAGIKLGV
jgi:very-short-patch-repair endonuclease